MCDVSCIFHTVIANKNHKACILETVQKVIERDILETVFTPYLLYFYLVKQFAFFIFYLFFFAGNNNRARSIDVGDKIKRIKTVSAPSLLTVDCGKAPRDTGSISFRRDNADEAGETQTLSGSPGTRTGREQGQATRV